MCVKLCKLTFMADADVSACYGGEEFISYLAETDTVGAELAAERVRSAIQADPFVLDDVIIRVTISIGIAMAPGHGESLKAFVGMADKALYRAKERGRNRVCIA